MQGVELAEDAPIVAMLNRTKVMRVKLRKKRIRTPQARIMNAQMFLQSESPTVNGLQTVTCFRTAAVVSSQIGQRLFAFENSGRSRWITSISRDVGAITALRQGNFDATGRISVGLRAQIRGESFQLPVRGRFGSVRLWMDMDVRAMWLGWLVWLVRPSPAELCPPRTRSLRSGFPDILC